MLLKNGDFSEFEKNCLLVYSIVFIYMAIRPYFFSVWLIENLTVLFGLCVAMIVRMRFCKFSKISLILITISFVLHTVGGHYAFVNVPLGRYIYFFGEIGRNNFDRLGHLSFGTLVYVVYDVSHKKRLFANNFAMLLFSFLAIFGVAGVYELLEWFDFLFMNKYHAELFIGSLVDSWDPHADLLCCLFGEFLATISFVIVHRTRCFGDRDMS